MEDKKPYPFDSGEIFEKGEIDTSSFTKEEFELVHREAGEKIHDTKMQGKPTTFAKDAIRRFAKNKSSVVAAAIIGVLLIASFLAPVVSPYDITTPVASISKMVPRIRPASDGFWDGTQYFSGQTYDEEAGVPVGFEKRCIVDGSMKYDGIQYQSGDPKPGYAYGYLRVRGDYLFSQKANNVFFQSYKTTKFSVGDGVKMTITFGLEDDIEGGVLASPSVYLYGQNNMAENVSLEAYPINSLSPRFLDDSAEEGDEEISTEEEFSSEEAIEIDGESVVTYDLSEALGN